MRNVQVFGDRLHVWLSESAAAVPAMTAALRDAGVEVCDLAPLAPGLEDVFFSLVT